MSDMQALFIDFENVAIWAEDEDIEFDLTRLMEYLRGRGAVVIKRAYGDWSRFPAYRDDLLNNAIDLIQMYSVSANRNKNRADIRLSLDALEVAMSRPQIKTFVIVSGDSDFGALIGRLREHGFYTLGIGPRSITHKLLVSACDEYVYLDTILGAAAPAEAQSISEQDKARQLLRKALAAFGQRGELPVPATRLKTALTSLDPAFNEANLGYRQFRDWLEANDDLAQIYFRELAMYVAPIDFSAPDGHEFKPTPAAQNAPPDVANRSFARQYRQALDKAVSLVDVNLRREVLRDLFAELSQQPATWNGRTLIDALSQRYVSAGLNRPRPTLLKVWQLAVHEQAFDFDGQADTYTSPVRLMSEITTADLLIQRAESAYVHMIIAAELPVDRGELAAALFDDRNQEPAIERLLDDLVQRKVITGSGHQFRIVPKELIPFRDEPALQTLIQDIEHVQLADDLPRGPTSARVLYDKALSQYSQDFAAAAHIYLQASRLQWDAVAEVHPDAKLLDLRKYLASYAARKAGALAQVDHNYAAARSYYLAFFALVQEDDPLWDQMNGLVNPMINYYWVSIARNLNITFLPAATPALTALQAATHVNGSLQQAWCEATAELARVNPRLLSRVAEQLRADRKNPAEAQRVADQIDGLVKGNQL